MKSITMFNLYNALPKSPRKVLEDLILRLPIAKENVKDFEKWQENGQLPVNCGIK